MNLLNIRAFILLILFLLLFDLQFRLNEPNNLSGVDDSSYFLHSETIAKDFDLDYSNQINFEDLDTNKFYFNPKNESFIPKHPIGVGILSSPFTFLGLLLERSNLFKNHESDLVYLIYSLSSIFYFSCSLILISKIEILLGKKQKENTLFLFVLLFGSGVGYFAFERFSMTHIYEVFSILLITYFVLKKLISNDKLTFLLGFGWLLPIFIRWTNYFLVLTPFLIYFVLHEKSLIRNRRFKDFFSTQFIFGIFTVPIIFIIFNYYFYGAFVYFPSQIYYSNFDIVDSLNSMTARRGYNLDFNIELVIGLVVDFLKILFSTEFGILYFSPLIFLSVFYCFYYLYKTEFIMFFLNLLIISLPFINVLVWKSTASSYGYRYLYSLIPLGIFYYFLIPMGLKKIVNIFIIFSFYSLIVFESNELTVLSKKINTFGLEHDYSANYYLDGVLQTFTDVNTLKVFGTSLIVVLLAKFITLIDPVALEKLFSSNNLLSSQYEKFLVYSETFNLNILLLILLFLLMNVALIFKSNNLDSS